MSHYRTKPEIIEAVQYNGENLDEINDFIGTPVGNTCKFSSGIPSGEIFFNTDMGIMVANPGSYIVKHDDGKISIVTKSEFLAEYEPID